MLMEASELVRGATFTRGPICVPVPCLRAVSLLAQMCASRTHGSVGAPTSEPMPGSTGRRTDRIVIGERTVVGGHAHTHPGVDVGNTCDIGVAARMGEDVTIGKTATVSRFAVIVGFAVIGHGVRVDSETVIPAGEVVPANTPETPTGQHSKSRSADPSR